MAESFAAAAHVALLNKAPASGGHDVTDVESYAKNFDPVITRQERLHYPNTQRNIRPVREYGEQLAKAEAIVLVYPAWWYGMPAMLKGYFDRVWLPGVAFDVAPDGRAFTQRSQRIRCIIAVTTYGGPWWMVRIAIGDPARKVVSRAIRAHCARGCRSGMGTFTTTWIAHHHAS